MHGPGTPHVQDKAALACKVQELQKDNTILKR